MGFQKTGQGKSLGTFDARELGRRNAAAGAQPVPQPAPPVAPPAPQPPLQPNRGRR